MSFSGLDLQHLRVVEIIGFEGGKVECDLAVRLIKAAAASVEKLILDLRHGRVYVSHRKENIDRYTSLVKELTEKETPSSKVDLVFTGYRKYETIDS